MTTDKKEPVVTPNVGPCGPGAHRRVPSGFWCNRCEQICGAGETYGCVCCERVLLKARIAELEAELAKYKKCDSCTEILFEHFAASRKDEFHRAAFHKEWE